MGIAAHISPQVWNSALGACQRELGAVFMSSTVLCREHSFQVKHLRNPLSEPMRMCEWLTASRLWRCLASLLLLDLNPHLHPYTEMRACFWAGRAQMRDAVSEKLFAVFSKLNRWGWQVPWAGAEEAPPKATVMWRLLPSWGRSLLDVPPERVQWGNPQLPETHSRKTPTVAKWQESQSR